MTLELKGVEYVIYDCFAEEDHSEPAKARYEAEFVWSRLVDSQRWITHTNTSIAAPYENSTRFVRASGCLADHHGGETRVDHEMKVFGDGVERDKVVEVEGFGHFED